MGSFIHVDALDFIAILEHAKSGTIHFNQVQGEGDGRIFRISEELRRRFVPGTGNCKILMLIEAAPNAEMDMDELEYLKDRMLFLYGKDVEVVFGQGINEGKGFPNEQLKVSMLVGYDGKG